MIIQSNQCDSSAGNFLILSALYLLNQWPDFDKQAQSEPMAWDCAELLLHSSVTIATKHISFCQAESTYLLFQMYLFQ